MAQRLNLHLVRFVAVLRAGLDDGNVQVNGYVDRESLMLRNALLSTHANPREGMRAVLQAFEEIGGTDGSSFRRLAQLVERYLASGAWVVRENASMPIDLLRAAGNDNRARMSLTLRLASADLGNLAPLVGAPVPRAAPVRSDAGPAAPLHASALAASASGSSSANGGPVPGASTTPAAASSKPVRKGFCRSSQLTEKLKKLDLVARKDVAASKKVAASKLHRTNRGCVQKKSNVPASRMASRCPHCKSWFSKPFNRDHHVQYNCAELRRRGRYGPKQFSCDFCDTPITDQKNLHNHNRRSKCGRDRQRERRMLQRSAWAKKRQAMLQKLGALKKSSEDDGSRKDKSKDRDDHHRRTYIVIRHQLEVLVDELQHGHPSWKQRKAMMQKMSALMEQLKEMKKKFSKDEVEEMISQFAFRPVFVLHPRTGRLLSSFHLHCIVSLASFA